MIFWLLLALAIVAGLGFCFLQDDYGISIVGFIGSFICMIGLVCLIAWKVSLHYDRVTCHAWAQKTGRETRFAYYNTFNWECLARAHDGKWVPTKQIGDFNK